MSVPQLPTGAVEAVPTLMPDVRPEVVQHGHVASHIGDIKLSDLRILLRDKGVQAFFQDRTLVCNNQVVIKKVIFVSQG